MARSVISALNVPIAIQIDTIRMAILSYCLYAIFVSVKASKKTENEKVDFQGISNQCNR